MMNIISRGVRKLEPYKPGKAISDLERELGIKNIIKLASNESLLPPSQNVIDAVKNVIKNCQRYPDGNGYTLKQKLSKKLSVSAQQITLGNGSEDIFGFVMRAFVEPKKKVLVSQYAFAAYEIAARAVGANLVEIPAIGWEHDLDGISKAVDKNTRVIFIANPNNPTGTWVTGTALRSFLENIPSTVLVVIDEAYFEYMTMLKDYPETLSWLKYYSNLIVTRTFSKAYSLAGFRVGYAVSSVELAEVLNRVRLPFNVNNLGLVAAETALEDTEYLAKVLKLTTIGRNQMTTDLDKIDLSYITSTANFLAINVKVEAEALYNSLLLEGIIVRPLQPYKMPQHIRISVGLHEENTRVMHALKKVLNKL